MKVRWLLTFSHEHNSWLACNCVGTTFVIPWTPVPASMARGLVDRGYTILDAI